MTVVHVVCEGQTEETFVRDVLAPHFGPSGKHLIAHTVTTKRTGTRAAGGGITSFAKLRKEIQLVLFNANTLAVTTMVDLYGLPHDFPGRGSVPPGTDCYGKVEHLERAFGEAIAHRKFVPYLSLHEFEALVLAADPDHFRSAFPGLELTGFLAQLGTLGHPEEIDDGVTTCPSARLGSAVLTYRKRLHGPQITGKAGLAKLRERCPHFDGWVRRLEALCG